MLLRPLYMQPYPLSIQPIKAWGISPTPGTPRYRTQIVIPNTIHHKYHKTHRHHRSSASRQPLPPRAPRGGVRKHGRIPPAIPPPTITPVRPGTSFSILASILAPHISLTVPVTLPVALPLLTALPPAPILVILFRRHACRFSVLGLAPGSAGFAPRFFFSIIIIENLDLGRWWRFCRSLAVLRGWRGIRVVLDPR
jgi:hypothetical protein